jgi:hypothetical protein
MEGITMTHNTYIEKIKQINRELRAIGVRINSFAGKDNGKLWVRQSIIPKGYGEGEAMILTFPSYWKAYIFANKMASFMQFQHYAV